MDSGRLSPWKFTRNNRVAAPACSGTGSYGVWLVNRDEPALALIPSVAHGVTLVIVLDVQFAVLRQAANVLRDSSSNGDGDDSSLRIVFSAPEETPGAGSGMLRLLTGRKTLCRNGVILRIEFDADPVAAKCLRGHQRGAASGEWIEDGSLRSREGLDERQQRR